MAVSNYADVKLVGIAGKAEAFATVKFKALYNKKTGEVGVPTEVEFETAASADGGFLFEEIILQDAMSGQLTYSISYVNKIGRLVESKSMKKFIDVDGPNEPPTIVRPKPNHPEGAEEFHLTKTQKIDVTGRAIPGNKIVAYNKAYDDMVGLTDGDLGLFTTVDEAGNWTIKSIPLFNDIAITENDDDVNEISFAQYDQFGIEGSTDAEGNFGEGLGRATLKVKYHSAYGEVPEPPVEPLERIELKESEYESDKPGNLVALEWSKDGMAGLRILSHFDVWYTKKAEIKWKKHNKEPIYSEKYEVSALEPDTDYVFQLIAVGTDNSESRSSDLSWNEADVEAIDRIFAKTSVTFVKDSIPPAVPYDVSAIFARVGLGEVRLSWKFKPEEDLEGFYVYESRVLPENAQDFNAAGGWGDPIGLEGDTGETVPFEPPRDDGEIVGEEMSVAIDRGDREDGTYYYAVEAVDLSGNASKKSGAKRLFIGPSSEAKIADPKPPSVVTAKTVKNNDGLLGVRISFEVLPEIGKYLIYRSIKNPLIVNEFDTWGDAVTVRVSEEILENLPEGAQYQYVDNYSVFPPEEDSEPDGLVEGEYFYVVASVSEVDEVDVATSELSDLVSAEVIEAEAETDTTPPSEASNLMVRSTSVTENELLWTISDEEDLAGYRVYRSLKDPADSSFVNPADWNLVPGPTDGSADEENSWVWVSKGEGPELNGVIPLPSVGTKVLYFDSKNIQSGRKYYYNVQAVDTATPRNYANALGDVEVPADTSHLEPLSKPEEVTAVAGNQEVRLQWRYDEALPDGSTYEVYRSNANPAMTMQFTGWDLVAEGVPEPTSGNYVVYYDQGGSEPSNGTTYYYSIVAVAPTGGNRSQYSDWVFAKPSVDSVIEEVPDAPVILDVTMRPDNQVEVSWIADFSGSIRGYNVFRSEIHPSEPSFEHPTSFVDLALLGSWQLASLSEGDIDAVDTLVPNPSAGETCVFLDSEHPANKRVYYAVQAVGMSDNSISLLSDLLSLYTEAPVIAKPTPETPEGFEVIQVAEGMQLRWLKNEDIPNGGYRIYRSLEGVEPTDWENWVGWERLKIDTGQYTVFDEVTIPQSSAGDVLTYVDKDATTNGQSYFYTVVALNGYGVESEYALYGGGERLASPDTEAPDAPVIASALVTSDLSVELMWAASDSDDVDGYNVYRSSLPESDGSFGSWGDPLNGLLNLIEHVEGVNEFVFVDEEVATGEKWYYAIEAVDESGNVSDKFAPELLHVEIPADQDFLAPAVVTGLITEGGDGFAKLFWDKVVYNDDDTNIVDLDGYEVLVSEKDPSYPVDFSSWEHASSMLIAQPTENVVQFLDSGVSNGTKRFYAIRARDIAGNISAIGLAFGVMPSASPDVDVPNVPQNVSVVVGGPQDVVLSWEKNTEIDLFGYNVYRSYVPVSDAMYVAPDDDWVDTGSWKKMNGDVIQNPAAGSVVSFAIPEKFVSPSQTYYYVVQARDTNNNISASSDVVEAVTPGS